MSTETKNDPTKRKKKHALIWWTQSRQKSIVPAAKIRKDQQFPNTKVQLWWTENGQRRLYEAKVICFSCKYSHITILNKIIVFFRNNYLEKKLILFTDDENELNAVPLSVDGEVVSGKIFSKESHDQREDVRAKNKNAEKNHKLSQKKANDCLLDDPGIFNVLPKNQHFGKESNYIVTFLLTALYNCFSVINISKF